MLEHMQESKEEDRKRFEAYCQQTGYTPPKYLCSYMPVYTKRAYSLFYKLLPQIQFAEHYASIATLPNDASSPTHFLYSVLFRNFAERSWRLGGGPLWFLPEKAAPWRARDDPRGNRSNPGIFE
jgi:hypothetical protein